MGRPEEFKNRAAIGLKSAVAAACAMSWLLAGDAAATTVLPPTFEEMVDGAELIFVGKVVGSRAEWRSVGTNQVIFTLVEFDMQEALKGRPGAAVTLQFLGGTVGAVTLAVSAVPKFSPGERVLLFVEGNGVQFCPLVGVSHGKFGLRKEERRGHDVVFMHNDRPLRDVAEIGSGEGVEFAPKRARASIPAGRGPMSLDDFKARIRSRLAKKAAQ